MQVALINKINGKYIISDITKFNGQDLDTFKYYAMVDDITKYIFNSLTHKYGKIYIEEKDVFNKLITKDSFIYKSDDSVKTNSVKTEEIDELEIDKIGLYKQLNRNIISQIEKIDFFTYIHYLSLFNYFASRGIFITKENKEDKYIEILELDDEKAIDNLELYLTLQDKLENFFEKNNKNISLMDEIEYADKEDLDKLKEEIIPDVIL